MNGLAKFAHSPCINPSRLRGGNCKPFDSMLGMLGSTPVLSVGGLVRRMPVFAERPEPPPEIFVKLESANPGWSVKARPALHMIEQAELRGDIKPDTVIIESSSGNTAIAIAMVAAMKGYTFRPVVDIKMPQAKLDLLRAFGAEVELVGDQSIPPEEQSMTLLKIERRATVQRLCDELGDRAYSPNQYANPDNAGAHMQSTGPELLEQMEGNLDALVLPMSTGGQIDGIGRFIKEHLPSTLLLATEPVGSTILKTQEGDYYNAGSGLDYTPKPVERMVVDGLIDDVWAIPDEASFKMSRLACKTTGALLGPTTGMQLFAALALAVERPELKRIATVGCDDGRAYVPDIMGARRTGELDTIAELENDLDEYNEFRRIQEAAEAVERSSHSMDAERLAASAR